MRSPFLPVTTIVGVFRLLPAPARWRRLPSECALGVEWLVPPCHWPRRRAWAGPLPGSALGNPLGLKSVTPLGVKTVTPPITKANNPHHSGQLASHSDTALPRIRANCICFVFEVDQPLAWVPEMCAVVWFLRRVSQGLA